MEPTNLVGMTPRYFHTIRTSCAILPAMHTTTLYVHICLFTNMCSLRQIKGGKLGRYKCSQDYKSFSNRHGFCVFTFTFTASGIHFLGRTLIYLHM